MEKTSHKVLAFDLGNVVFDFDYLYKKYKPVFSLFDDLILSFRLKAVKPEETIYQALKTAAGGAFKNIIYIDR